MTSKTECSAAVAQFATCRFDRHPSEVLAKRAIATGRWRLCYVTDYVTDLLRGTGRRY